MGLPGGTGNPLYPSTANHPAPAPFSGAWFDVQRGQTFRRAGTITGYVSVPAAQFRIQIDPASQGDFPSLTIIDSDGPPPQSGALTELMSSIRKNQNGLWVPVCSNPAIIAGEFLLDLLTAGGYGASHYEALGPSDNLFPIAQRPVAIWGRMAQLSDSRSYAFDCVGEQKVSAQPGNSPVHLNYPLALPDSEGLQAPRTAHPASFPGNFIHGAGGADGDLIFKIDGRAKADMDAIFNRLDDLAAKDALGFSGGDCLGDGLPGAGYSEQVADVVKKKIACGGIWETEAVMFARSDESHPENGSLPGWAEAAGASVLVNGVPVSGDIGIAQYQEPELLARIAGTPIGVDDTVRLVGALVLDCGHAPPGHVARTCQTDNESSNVEIHPIFSVDVLSGSPFAGDVSGVWGDDEGGTYYVVQRGTAVVWLGMSPFRDDSFAQIFAGTATVVARPLFGTIVRSVHGSWIDVPLGARATTGDVTFTYDPFGDRGPTLIADRVGALKGRSTSLVKLYDDRVDAVE